MNNYETVFIMKGDITEEERKNTISRIEQCITKSGKITNIQDLGIKKLAYEVKKYAQGYYYSIDFQVEPKLIAELERIYRITDEILKFIVIRKDE